MMDSRPVVVVVGAGVVGSSIAFHLARSGANVSLFDMAEPASGTSGASFAWVNAHEKSPREYHDLNVAGMLAHRTLAAELAADWYRPSGSIEWRAIADRESHQANVERLRANNYAAEWISPDDAVTLAPQIDRACIGDAPVAYFADEGWVDAVAYTRGLVRHARAHGATIFSGTKIARINIDGARVTGIATENGIVHDADVVVNCTGRWADSSAFPANLRIPLAPSLGLLVFVRAEAVDLKQVLFTPQCHIRPDGNGRLLICQNDAISTPASDTPIHPTMPEADALIAKARAILPAIGPAVADEVRLGVRAFPADGLPTIGPVPGVNGYYAAVMHSGITLAPAVGALVAAEIATGTRQQALARFRPDRLIEEFAAHP